MLLNSRTRPAKARLTSGQYYTYAYAKSIGRAQRQRGKNLAWHTVLPSRQIARWESDGGRSRGGLAQREGGCPVQSRHRISLAGGINRIERSLALRRNHPSATLLPRQTRQPLVERHQRRPAP